MNDSLMCKWVSQKAMEDYVEPTRKGTPRGEPIGLSARKRLAALFAITRTKVMDQANWIGVSYGLLRKWRTEPEFKKQAKQFAKEFEAWLMRGME